MPKKRTSNDACTIDKSTNEDSDSFEHGNDAKRAKLTPLCDTTLNDLPMELIASILVEAAAMEVTSMKLAKCAWKAKADVVIDRLSIVCSQWDSILRTSFFRNELHRTLDRTAEETIRLEILQQLPLDFVHVYKMASLRDEIFLLCLPQHKDHDYFINVYDRNNMAEVKDVVPLPGFRPWYMAACNASNCAYILNEENGAKHVSIWRMKRDDENQFAVSPLITDVTLRMPVNFVTLCVTANGWLILTRQQTKSLDAITVFDADGSVLHTLRLPSRLASFSYVIPKSNGNLVLVFCMTFLTSPDDITKTDFIEIDMSGTVIRKYRSSYPDEDSMPICVSRADNHGRLLWTADQGNRMELLDSELNVVQFTAPQLRKRRRGQLQFDDLQELHYDSESDEIIACWTDNFNKKLLLSIYKLT